MAYGNPLAAGHVVLVEATQSSVLVIALKVLGKMPIGNFCKTEYQ